MKVFLSWSGTLSHKVAKVLRDWFPSVIQSLEPYVSSEDIDKGARWSTDISKELENSKFGLLCVTKENINAPWLTFEAGALSKTMDKTFVSPLLFDIKRSDVDGPILQFQSTIFEKDDILKLLKTLNKACEKEKLSDERLEKTFEVWWPTLETELNKIRTSQKPKEKKEEIKVEDSTQLTSKILEEILELSRNNQRILRNPEELFPAGYFRYVLEKLPENQIPTESILNHPIWMDIFTTTHGIERELIKQRKTEAPMNFPVYEEHFKNLVDMINYVETKWFSEKRHTMRRTK